MDHLVVTIIHVVHTDYQTWPETQIDLNSCKIKRLPQSTLSKCQYFVTVDIMKELLGDILLNLSELFWQLFQIISLHDYFDITENNIQILRLFLNTGIFLTTNTQYPFKY